MVVVREVEVDLGKADVEDVEVEVNGTTLVFELSVGVGVVSIVDFEAVEVVGLGDERGVDSAVDEVGIEDVDCAIVVEWGVIVSEARNKVFTGMSIIIVLPYYITI